MPRIRTIFFLNLILLIALIGSVHADLEPLQNGSPIGLGKYDGTGITILGDFKDCSANAFFYMILVNGSDAPAEVIMPKKIFIEPRTYYLSPDSYTYTDLGADWNPDQYPAGRDGFPLELSAAYGFTLPAHTAYAVMGTVNNIHPRAFYPITEAEDEFKMVFTETELSFNNTLMKSMGYIQRQGSACDAVTSIPVQGENYFAGSYGIHTETAETCSFAFYLRAANSDLRHPVAMDLPHWMNIEGNRYSIGCEILDETCPVSGFRHYAYAIAEPETADQIPPDSQFSFCDRDFEQGDRCFTDNSGEKENWWLEIPPNSTVYIRGMVNDLCSNPAGYQNPLTADRIRVEMLLIDMDNHQRTINGEIYGVPKSISQASAAQAHGDNPLMLIAPAEERDPDRLFFAGDADAELIFDHLSLLEEEKGEEDPIDLGISHALSINPYPYPGQQPAPAPQEEQRPLASFAPLKDAATPADCGSLCDYKMPATGFTGFNHPQARPKGSFYNSFNGLTLQIPSIDVLAPIVSVPTVADGRTWDVEFLDIEAGHLTGTTNPGDGISVLAAHNHLNLRETGPFSDLYAVRLNDRVFVTDEQNEMQIFRVYKNILMGREESMERVYAYARPNSLILLTCENESTDGGYAHRRLVYAEPYEQ